MPGQVHRHVHAAERLVHSCGNSRCPLCLEAAPVCAPGGFLTGAALRSGSPLQGRDPVPGGGQLLFGAPQRQAGIHLCAAGGRCRLGQGVTLFG